MKHTKIVLLIALMAIFCSFGMEAKGKKARAQFTEYKYDLGNVPEKGGPVSHEFKFTNTGDGNLIIIDASTTCGCTRPEYPKNPIAPGKSGKIKVTYLPDHRPGPIDRTITVRTNGNPKKVRLRILGNVIPGKK